MSAEIWSRASCEGVVPLTARLEPWMEEVFASNLLPGLIERYGSPVNLQSTAPFKRNLAKLQQVAEERNLRFKPFFARKANKCLAYVDAARGFGCGVDTASLAEVEQCLERGLPGADIVCTAAVKSGALLRLCLDNGVTIILDNDDEWHLLSNLAREAGRPATIGIRVAGFEHDGGRLHSRFGFPVDRLPVLLKRHRTEFADLLELRGLHFHLNGYDAEHRISALRQLLPFAIDLKRTGDLKRTDERPVFIDIGGGLPMRYLANPAEWDDRRS